MSNDGILYLCTIIIDIGRGDYSCVPKINWFNLNYSLLRWSIPSKYDEGKLHLWFFEQFEYLNPKAEHTTTSQFWFNFKSCSDLFAIAENLERISAQEEQSLFIGKHNLRSVTAVTFLILKMFGYKKWCFLPITITKILWNESSFQMLVATQSCCFS